MFPFEKKDKKPPEPINPFSRIVNWIVFLLIAYALSKGLSHPDSPLRKHLAQSAQEFRQAFPETPLKLPPGEKLTFNPATRTLEMESPQAQPAAPAPHYPPLPFAMKPAPEPAPAAQPAEPVPDQTPPLQAPQSNTSVLEETPGAPPASEPFAPLPKSGEAAQTNPHSEPETTIPQPSTQTQQKQ
jgi:hypothetical protein